MRSQVRWIRTPAFDVCWILSGLPLGLFLWSLAAFFPRVFIEHFCIFLFQSGHLWAPIVLAWSHRDFRGLMLKARAKYIFVPISILMLATTIGYYVSLHLEREQGGGEDSLIRHLMAHPQGFNYPLILLLEVYLIWNGYHFAAQDYGVLSLYRNKAQTYRSSQRSLDKIFCYLIGVLSVPPILFKLLRISLVSTPDEAQLLASSYVLISLAATLYMIQREFRLAQPCSWPRIVYILTKGLGVLVMLVNPLVGFAIYSLNHWTVSIGLSSHIFSVHKARTTDKLKWYYSFGAFAGGMILLSLAYIFFLVITSFQLDAFDLSRLEFHLTATAMAARMGLGIVHFLYDRYLFKFGRQEVRMTIGRDLMSMPAQSDLKFDENRQQVAAS